MGKYAALLEDAPKPGKYAALLESNPAPNPGDAKPDAARTPAAPEPGLGEAMARSALPRSFKAEEEGAGALRKALAGAFDALSLPGRTLASVASAKTEGNPYAYAMGSSYGLPKEAQRFEVKSAEPIGETEGKGLVSRTLRDPALPVSLAVGGPPTSGVGKAGLTGLKALKAAMASGGLQGAASAAVHQGDNASQGKKISPQSALMETVTGALLPAVAAGVGKGVQWTNKALGRLAESLSGVSEEALRTHGAGFGKGAKELAQAAGKENEIGHKLLHAIDNIDDFMPEKEAVNKILNDMPDMSIDGVVGALESSKVLPRGGVLLPNEQAANARIDTFIQALKGNAPNADEVFAIAGKNRQAAQELADDLKAVASISNRASDKASKSALRAASEQGATAKAVQDLPDKGKGFFRWHTNEEDAARVAAQRAQEAAVQARARVAVGEITSREADAAERAAEAAYTRLAIADGAKQIAEGKNLTQVGEDLAKRYTVSDDDLLNILQSAKKMGRTATAGPAKISAADFRDLRRRLDVNIDFNTEDGAIVNEALKKARGTMRGELEAAADASGKPEYANLMRSWADKLDKLDNIKGMLGRNGATRERRIETFISTLFGKNKTERQSAVKALGDIFGEDFLQQAKLAKLAAEFGPEGKAGLLPQQFTGRAALGPVLAAAGGHFINPGVSIVPLALSSPRVAATTLAGTDALTTVARDPRLQNRAAAVGRALLRPNFRGREDQTP